MDGKSALKPWLPCLALVLAIGLPRLNGAEPKFVEETERRLKPILEQWLAKPIKVVPEHPRIYFTRADLPVLKARAAALETDKWPDDERFKRVQGAPEVAAFYWHATGRKEYKDLALAEWKRRQGIDWKTDEAIQKRAWLDAPGYATSYALLYDWLHDQVPEEERAKARQTMREIVAKHLHGPGHYQDKSYHNGYYICLDAMATVGAALAGDDPAGLEYLQNAYASFLEGNMRNILSAGRGGGWWEGYTYQHMSVPCIVRVIEIFRVATGIDLMEMPELRDFLHKNAWYTFYMLVPWLKNTDAIEEDSWVRQQYLDGDVFDRLRYAGQHKRRFLLYIIQRTRDPLLHWFLLNSGNQLTWSYTRDKIWDILWYDPKLPAQAPTPETMPLVDYIEGVGLIFMRSDWTDQATYVSFQCGDHFSFHHWQQNSQVSVHREGGLVPLMYGDAFKLSGLRGGNLGETWAKVKANYATGHVAQIQAFDHGACHTYVLGDFSDQLNGLDGGRVTREVLFVRPDLVILFDRVKPETVFSFHTHNAPRVEGALCVIDAHPEPWSRKGFTVEGRGFVTVLWPEKFAYERKKSGKYEDLNSMDVTVQPEGQATEYLTVCQTATRKVAAPYPVRLLKDEDSLGVEIVTPAGKIAATFALSKPQARLALGSEEIAFPRAVRNVPNVSRWWEENIGKVVLPR